MEINDGVLYFIVLYCIILYCIVLCCVVLRCVALRCVASRRIVLYLYQITICLTFIYLYHFLVPQISDNLVTSTHGLYIVGGCSLQLYGGSV